jgi:hypothetical protein
MYSTSAKRRDTQHNKLNIGRIARSSFQPIYNLQADMILRQQWDIESTQKQLDPRPPFAGGCTSRKGERHWLVPKLTLRDFLSGQCLGTLDIGQDWTAYLSLPQRGGGV